MFNVSRNEVSSSSVKTIKVCPRIKWESARFQNSTVSMYRGLKNCEAWNSTTSSIDTLSIEVYKIQFFRANFNPIREYVFRLSFLTTLNIHKDYFKGRHNLCNLMQKFFTSILWTENICPSSFFFIQEAVAFVRRWVLWLRSFVIFIMWWTEELCNQHLSQVSD